MERNWEKSYSQFPQEKDYVAWAETAGSLIDFEGTRTACVFNCCDGPSARGLISAVIKTAPAATIYVADISPYAADSCVTYNHRFFPRVPIEPLVCPSEQLAQKFGGLILPVDTFVSFEPVGRMEQILDTMKVSLGIGGRIVICARNLLDMGLNTLAKRKYHDDPHFIYTFYSALVGKYPVYSGELMKVG